MKKSENLSSITLSIFGIVLVVDATLEQVFNIGIRQNSLVIAYCILFVILIMKFQDIIKKIYVMIPMYLMILQTFYCPAPTN